MCRSHKILVASFHDCHVYTQTASFILLCVCISTFQWNATCYFLPPERAQQSLVTYILVYLPVSSTVIDDPFLVYVMVVTPLSFWILPLTLRYTGADVAP